MRIPTILLAALAWLSLSSCAEAPQDGPSRTDVMRNEALIAAETPAFTAWIRAFRPRALAAGIADRVYDRAFARVRYNPEVVERDRNQAEFSKPIWEYLDLVASESRVRNGREALARHARTLAAIEARYDVDREVIVAIWGLESAYGTRRGDTPVIEALATLAYDGRRGAFFERQLIAALKILQAGDVAPERMTGSWAGAMGHTQFIPTSYLAYAVDFGGDGRRDIWSDDPTDALASTAAYLRRFNWRRGEPWGIEVRLPTGFDYGLTGGTRMSVTDWNRLGVRDMDGRPVRDYGPARILVPAGAGGTAFMVFRNFTAIERYNAADAYVIGVGHLSDRLKGGGPLRGGWPREARQLDRVERQAMQEGLLLRGLDTGGVDGILGPRSIEAIRAFQKAEGMTPDGYPSFELLSRMR